MNIGCIYSVEDYVSNEKPLYSFSAISFGIAYVSTALKNAGFKPEILVFTPNSPIHKMLMEYIHRCKPKLFCMTAVSSQFHMICKIAREIKAIDENIKILLGGHHATLNPNEAIIAPYIDAICIGEGEMAAVQYAKQIEDKKAPTGINNLWIKNNGKLEKNDLNAFHADIDQLPVIDRTLWQKWVADKQRMPSILIGRGCPNHCTYCSNHAIVRKFRGKYVRFRSPKNVISEVKSILATWPHIQYIHLEAETFGANLQYAYNLCRALIKFNQKQPRKLKFTANLALNPQLVDNSYFVSILKSANFDTLNIGLESGAEHIRNNVLKRPKYSNQDIIRFCNNAKTHGLKVNLFAMIGIPGETRQDFKQTIQCIRECDPQHVYLYIFYPYPGTALYSRVKSMNLLKETIPNPKVERKRPKINIPGFMKWQIQFYYIFFPFYAYKDEKSFLTKSALTLRSIIGMFPIFNSFYRKMVQIRSIKQWQVRLAKYSR